MAGFGQGVKEFFLGSPGKATPYFTKKQQPIADQMYSAAQGRNEGGAFGTAADYYNDLYSGDQNYNAFAAPIRRQYQEDIMPGIAEQFAGMGAGGLSSSGFRNAAIQGGTDLAERLASIRGQLRQQGAQGLQNLGSLGLQNYNMQTDQPTSGFLQPLATAAGAALGSFGGPAGTAAGASLGNWLGGKFQNVGQQQGNPTQNSGFVASPQMSQQTSGQYNLPTFMGR